MALRRTNGLIAILLCLAVWPGTTYGQAGEQGRWQVLENNPSCVVWNVEPQLNLTVMWSGACVNGKAQGRGTQVWRYLEDEEWKETKYTDDMKCGGFGDDLEHILDQIIDKIRNVNVFAAAGMVDRGN